MFNDNVTFFKKILRQVSGVRGQGSKKKDVWIPAKFMQGLEARERAVDSLISLFAKDLAFFLSSKISTGATPISALLQLVMGQVFESYLPGCNMLYWV